VGAREGARAAAAAAGVSGWREEKEREEPMWMNRRKGTYD
jgi:hypothetical protein